MQFFTLRAASAVVLLSITGIYLAGGISGESEGQLREESLFTPLAPLERAAIQRRSDEERFYSPPKSESRLFSSEGERASSDRGYRVVLDPLYRTKYFPQVQVIAPVVKLAVKEGDSFKKGDLILQLDPAKFSALYKKTEAVLEKSKEELRAKERLFKDGNGSYFDYIDAKANLATAEAEFVFAQKNVEAQTVIAPYDGKVASLSIQEYELPLENKEMLELIFDSSLVGKVLLPARLARNVKVGDEVEIYIEDIKSKILAKISHLASVIEPSSSTFKIEIEIDNSQGILIPGMGGYIIIPEEEPS